jgi:hypothetical protein
MPTTTKPPMTREEKLRRYIELSAFEIFLDDVRYLFDGIIDETETLHTYHPDELRPRELTDLVEELFPRDEWPDDGEPPEWRHASVQAELLAARLFARAAGESRWFGDRANERIANAARPWPDEAA